MSQTRAPCPPGPSGATHVLLSSGAMLQLRKFSASDFSLSLCQFCPKPSSKFFISQTTFEILRLLLDSSLLFSHFS